MNTSNTQCQQARPNLDKEIEGSVIFLVNWHQFQKMNHINNVTFVLTLIMMSSHIMAQSNISFDTYKKSLDQILQDDQRHRKDNKEKQMELDKQNRVKLDQLYEEYGFPSIKKVGRERLLTAILILHHSEDCDWNKRWIRIFLNHYEDVVQFKTLMKYMFERTYGPELGICQATEFINSLINKYPEEVISELGIDQLQKGK